MTMIQTISPNYNGIFNKQKLSSSYDDCKKEVQKYKFKNKNEYKNNRKNNWPSNPNMKYKDNWNGWSDFLGNGRKTPQFAKKVLPYDDCKKEVRKYKFKNKNEYKNNRKDNWPSHPNVTYKDNWNGWSDFLGNGKKTPQFAKKILPYDDCKKEVQKYKFKSNKEYKNNRKDNWPSNPDIKYKDNWNGWSDFLGTGRRKIQQFAKKVLPYDDCKKEVRKYKFKNKNEYKNNRKNNWPNSPNEKYKDNWNGWSDFLGNGKKTPQRAKEFLPYEDCKKEVRKYKFKNLKEYKNNRKDNWPSHPDEKYKNNWNGWGDFLGNTKR